MKDNQNVARIKIVCPVCGREMDETYTGNQYCWVCAQSLKNNKAIAGEIKKTERKNDT